jgi:hypothetical protein
MQQLKNVFVINGGFNEYIYVLLSPLSNVYQGLFPRG